MIAWRGRHGIAYWPKMYAEKRGEGALLLYSVPPDDRAGSAA